MAELAVASWRKGADEAAARDGRVAGELALRAAVRREDAELQGAEPRLHLREHGGLARRELVVLRRVGEDVEQAAARAALDGSVLPVCRGVRVAGDGEREGAKMG